MASGIPINATLIFTPEQALLAAKAGAKVVSPSAGRIDDDLRKGGNLRFDKTDYYPQDGMTLNDRLLEDNGVVSGIDPVAQCVRIIEHYELQTGVLSASLRDPRQVRESALADARIATLPLGVLQDMLKHPKTYGGMALFTADIAPEYAALG